MEAIGQKPRRRQAGHASLLLLAAAACLLAAWRHAAPLATFAAPPAARPSLGALGGAALRAACDEARVALRAEAEDAAEMVEPEVMQSVFDGPVRDTFKKKFDGTWYRVTMSNWTWTTRFGKSGDWARAWSMPVEEFAKRKKELKQRWRKQKRKLRLKHGKGQRYPNGKLIFLCKLQGNPFTREQFGEKYIGRAAWHYSPNEILARERQMRALELKSILEQKAEEVRVKRMQELNVGLGDPIWRRRWRAKVEYVKEDRSQSYRKAVDRSMSAEDAEAATKRFMEGLMATD